MSDSFPRLETDTLSQGGVLEKRRAAATVPVMINVSIPR
jgi:hypothetical protein